MPRNKRVLVSTIWADGGVAAMTKLMISLLSDAGFDVALAYYMPYKHAPQLSVPSWQLLTRSPARRLGERFGVPAHEIGVRLPEFEWTRGLASRQWREVIDDYDIHVASCGSILAALPPLLAGKQCLAWVATPYMDDRRDRIKAFPPMRRLLDSLIDIPICLMLEKWALRNAALLSLSEYTQAALHDLAPGISSVRMPVPVNASRFDPVSPFVSAGRIGFAGRYTDPRKNVKLLIDAVQLCRDRGLSVVLDLVGGDHAPDLVAYAAERGLSEHVVFHGLLSLDKLPDFYRSLDVFVIPSLQEGLAIVGLEAMASGCPVISTRCGGPEEFVIDGVNGRLVTFDAAAMADAIASIVTAPERRAAMAQAALETVRTKYTEGIVAETFYSAFEKTFGTRRPISD